MTIKVKEVVERFNLQVLAGEENLENNIDSVYMCDLLSNVLAHGKSQTLWITIQTHQNIVAVASLLNFSAILLPESLLPDEQTLQRAKTEGVTLLQSDKSAYTLAGELYKLGLKE